MELLEIVKEAEARLAPVFARVDRVAEHGTAKVMAAFREERVSNGMFASTDGYGYDDRGRDVLDKIYARVFDAEAAFVRSSVLSGTHALAIGLFGLVTTCKNASNHSEHQHQSQQLSNCGFHFFSS